MIPNIQIPNILFATLGDIAAAGLGYAAGFVLGLFVKGDTKSAVEIAGVFAVGCVGIKNLGQLWLIYPLVFVVVCVGCRQTVVSRFST